MKNRINSFLLLALIGLSVQTQANVKPNSLFSDNFVLQRNVEVPVWGTADTGEKVSVEFNGQKVETVAANGKWMVKLKAMKENAIAQEMIIKGNNTVTVKNILIGEVWLCSGQSNMAFPLRAIRPIGNNPSKLEVLQDAQKYPNIRQFTVSTKKTTVTPPLSDDTNGKWYVCDSVNAKNFTAVGYLFARELYKNINLPIGIIQSAYGGTKIENWISMEVLESDPVSREAIASYKKSLDNYPAVLEKFKADEPKLWDKFRADSAIAVNLKKELPRKPAVPQHPAERGGVSGLYNSMINPLIPYAMKGVVWYQGEANAALGIQYRTLLPQLIKDWRTKWGIELPVLIVQIPGWKAHKPELKEAQLLTWQKTPKTAMVVTYDVDDTLDVHPGNKQPVGERLALAARAVAYGDKVEYSGPIYESMKVDGNKIVLTFTHGAKSLVAKNGDLKDFTIAGDDKNFVPAKAEIKKNTVIVTAVGVDKPVAVRAGWRLCPQMNLYNNENLPASPFRTDDWDTSKLKY